MILIKPGSIKELIIDTDIFSQPKQYHFEIERHNVGPSDNTIGQGLSCDTNTDTPLVALGHVIKARLFHWLV